MNGVEILLSLVLIIMFFYLIFEFQLTEYLIYNDICDADGAVIITMAISVGIFICIIILN